MIAAFILAVHGFAGIYAFWTRGKSAGWGEGVLALAFVGVIFSVGWTIMTMLVSIVFPPEGFAEWLNRDTVALGLVTIAEGVFYYFFLRSDGPEKDKPSQEPQG